MALSDVLLKQLSKNKDKVGDTSPANNLKSKAALIISLFAAIYSFNAFMSGQISSSILNNTIKANDTWAFYQAKSIKQTQYDIAAEEAQARGDNKKYVEYLARVERYETEPGEGKRDLMAKAKQIEADRDLAKKKSPWIGIAGSIMQIAIVLLTASILSSGMLMFWAGLGAMGFAIVLMLQGLFLFF
jgi:hypothetical protein